MLVISIPQEFCSSEKQAGVVPHAVQALCTSRGRVWQGSGTYWFYINRCLGDNSFVLDCWDAYSSLPVCTCAHGFLGDSKLRVHLAGMNTSHNGKSTVEKMAEQYIFSHCTYLPFFSFRGFSAKQYCVAKEIQQKEKGRNHVWEQGIRVSHIPVWLL